ncbi:ATP-binding cassette domain-containing protein, partial [Adlercreutzia sp. DFI.6.23]|uniref:ATP-binding cassette domain-containing protein n=1 Tax=Adlercreutzia sp. DFI.6.23 TaxID=2963705 RepID=UPI00210A9F33
VRRGPFGDLFHGRHGQNLVHPAHPAGTEVALENVTFAYPGSARPALRDVSLTVPAGATVALVGPSGGGKSTLASLVPRFWDPQEGVVAVGGADVRR